MTHAYATLLWPPLEVSDGEYPPYPVPRDRAVVTSGRTGPGRIP